MEPFLSSACTQTLCSLLKLAPGRILPVHVSASSHAFLSTYSTHDISIVYTETTDSTEALTLYTTYQSRLPSGGMLIYYMDAFRQNVNVALHTISTDEFEITYFSKFIVFTKGVASDAWLAVGTLPVYTFVAPL